MFPPSVYLIQSMPVNSCPILKRYMSPAAVTVKGMKLALRKSRSQNERPCLFGKTLQQIKEDISLTLTRMFRMGHYLLGDSQVSGIMRQSVRSLEEMLSISDAEIAGYR